MEKIKIHYIYNKIYIHKHVYKKTGHSNTHERPPNPDHLDKVVNKRIVRTI